MALIFFFLTWKFKQFRSPTLACTIARLSNRSSWAIVCPVPEAAIRRFITRSECLNFWTLWDVFHPQSSSPLIIPLLRMGSCKIDWNNSISYKGYLRWKTSQRLILKIGFENFWNRKTDYFFQYTKFLHLRKKDLKFSKLAYLHFFHKIL